MMMNEQKSAYRLYDSYTTYRSDLARSTYIQPEAIRMSTKIKIFFIYIILLNGLSIFYTFLDR